MQVQAILTASLLLLLFWKRDGISSAAEPGYLDFDNLPETNFSCESKVIGGYYADVETGCQMFHVCTIGQKGEITDIKFLCLNGTVFDQETRVCERLDEVDCSKTESFFDLNLQLYGNKAGPFGIEPENEEIVEEECDPEDEEECQRTEDGGVREEEEEDNGGGGGGGGGEKVPSNNNNGGVIQQTTFSPISVTTTTTKRPNVFSSTSTARVPTTTLQPSTTGQPAFQSGDPDTIAALLALHNAFAQSLQHHDINNKQQQEQQQAQQQEQIEQQQREIEEHQRKQHLQQIHQQKQQAQLQHQQAQLQHHQAHLHHQQQKITQQAAKQAANAYAAAVNSQAPTPKPLPPPPPPLRQVPQHVPQQVLQQHVPQSVPQVPQTPQPSNHRFPAQIHYDTSKHPLLQDAAQKVLQQQHRFPQQQIHYESSTPQQDAPQQRFPQPQQDAPQQRFPQPQQDVPQQRFNSQPQLSRYEPVKADANRFPQTQGHYEVAKSPVIGPQQERFGGEAYVSSQQNFGQNVRLPVQSAERPKPFSFHQYDSQPSTTASPYLLHQLKVNRVKQEQQHSNFPRQAQRSITTPALAVVTSTSTTTSIRSGKKGPLHTSSETFLGSSVTSSSSEVTNGTLSSGEYDEYQEGDVATDPFFQDVPKIGRSRREVAGVKGSISRNDFDNNEQKIDRSRREVAGVKRSVSDNAIEKSDQKVGRSRREVTGVKSSMSGNGFENNAQKGHRSRREVAGVKGSIDGNGFENNDQKIGRSRRDVTGVKGSISNNLLEKVEATFLNEKIIGRSRRDVGEVRRSINLGSDSLENENIYKYRKLAKREARYVKDDEDDDDDRYVQREVEEDEENRVGRRKNKSNKRKNVKKSSKNRKTSSKNRNKSSKNRNKSKKNYKRSRKIEKGKQERDRDRESSESSRERSAEETSREREESEEEIKKVSKKNKVGSNNKPSKKTTSTTPKPVETTEKPKEPDMKNIPLDNNEFTDIIDKVQQTISAKVVSIQQPIIHKHKGNKDNLQLSPEERKYYTEVAAVMSKYIPPPAESESLEEGESTPNMSARDKQRLSMFVTSKAKRKKKKDVGTYVIRNKRQATKENKQYEVSEVVDEPTTQEPSARRLINQYRTSGIVPSQLISELIQRMDLSSKEQVSGDTVSSSRNLNSQSNSRRQTGEQVRSRVSSQPHRDHERSGVLENVQERNVDPNTRSLHDVIFNSGHHRMVLRKGFRRVKGQSGDLGSSDQDRPTLLNRGHDLESSNQDKPTLSNRSHDSGSSNPGKMTLSNKGHPDEIQGTSINKDLEVKSKQKVLSSSEESLEKDDDDSSMDYSLEKEESNLRPSSSLKNGEKVRETYAVSEEDEGDEKPSTNLPFLYQDQISGANTGEERYSSFDSGSSLPMPVDGDIPRGNLNDRISNYHKATRAPTPVAATTQVADTIPVSFSRGDSNDRISNYHKATRAPTPVAATIPVALHRGDSNDRISNFHKPSTAPTPVSATTPKAPSSAVLNQRISNYNRGSNSDSLVGGNTPRDNLNDRISNFHKESSHSIPTSRDNLSLESNGRYQEPSKTTNVGSQDSSRVRNRPIGSQRKFTTNVAIVDGSDSESTTNSRVTLAPRRRRPTSRARERLEEPVETSTESSRSTGLRRRRPTSRVRENLEEDFPQAGVAQNRQSQRSRSKDNLNSPVGTTDQRSSGRASLVKDDSRTISESFRSIPEISRSIPESSRPILESSRSNPERSRPVPEGSIIPDNSWIPDSSRAVLESSRLLPESSRTPESSQLIPEGSRTIPDKPRSVTSRRRPANVDPERVEEGGKQIVNIQQTPRKNGVSRTRQPSLVAPKELTTESSEAEEEVEGETTDSYESQAKKLHSQLFPGENFSCEGKIKGGFYADIETDCRGFFICSQGEINGPLLKSHFWCGEATKFNQRSRTCQADYLVECSISTRYFGLNNDFAVPTLETNTFEPLKVS